MHDTFDIHLMDLESLGEIATLTDLMIAATDSRVDRLTPEAIDRILHVA
jgi:hypothetical protein